MGAVEGVAVHEFGSGYPPAQALLPLSRPPSGAVFPRV